MAYELRDAVLAGNISSTFVQARDSTFTKGGSISPDGSKIAVLSRRHGRSGSDDYGIDIWHFGDSGWAEATSIDLGGGTPIADSIYWYSDTEILVLVLDQLRSFTLGNDGNWSSSYDTNIGSQPTHMWVSPGKTVIGLAESINWFSDGFMDDTKNITFIHSVDSQFTGPVKTFQMSQGRVTAMSWIDETNVLVGQPFFNNNAGLVTHLQYSGDSYSKVRSCQGNTGADGGNKFGSFIYWHSVSNSGIFGAQTAAGNTGEMVLNLIPKPDDGFIPTGNPHLALGRTVIDTSGLQRNDGAAPVLAAGTSLNVDRSTSDRVVATTVQKANDVFRDNRIHFSLEFGSSGWIVAQINSDGDSVANMNDNTLNASQLSSGASRFVTFKIGRDTTDSDDVGFTVYDTGLPSAGSQPGLVVTTSKDPFNLTEGSSATVSVRLVKQPLTDVVVSIALAGNLSDRASLSANTLTFTNANWDTAQSITVSATGNVLDDGDITDNITFSINDASSDDTYDSVADQTVSLTVLDDDETPADPSGDVPSDPEPAPPPVVPDPPLDPILDPPIVDPPVDPPKDPPSRRVKKVKNPGAQTPFSNKLERFERRNLSRSTIENIDTAVYNFIDKQMNIFTDSNEGFKKVPVIMASSERASLSKRRDGVRDSDGTLVLPLITVERTSISKNPAEKGTVWANIPPTSKIKGGSIPMARYVVQDKTANFKNAQTKRRRGQLNFPDPLVKTVYRTVNIPIPVYITVMYSITVRTDYQQQMNDIIVPFMTRPGGINYIIINDESKRYEAFVQQDFGHENNISDFSNEERKFETKFDIKVLGYLIGDGTNQLTPHRPSSENIVEVKIPRERASLSEEEIIKYNL